MNKRKDQLRAMFEGGRPELEKKSEPAQTASLQPKRSASGAVKAMGLSLDNLSREAEEARRLRQSLEDGARVIDLNPHMIDASIVEDRLDAGGAHDDGFAALKASLAASGQQVPVLVRIHPDSKKADAGWFQAAYGHRRIRAARELGLPVKAIVRALDDAALLVAQGKENAERRDLSYIERALFARSMLKAGFERATAMTALCVDKTEMSRLLQIAEAVPENIIRAIGPAPKIGRPRWHALGELFGREAQRAKAMDEITNQRFYAASSDDRFQLVFERLSKRTSKAQKLKPIDIKDSAGRALARIVKTDRKTSIEIEQKDHAAFADFLAGELPRLASEYQRSKGLE